MQEGDFFFFLPGFEKKFVSDLKLLNQKQTFFQSLAGRKKVCFGFKTFESETNFFSKPGRKKKMEVLNFNPHLKNFSLGLLEEFRFWMKPKSPHVD